MKQITSLSFFNESSFLLSSSRDKTLKIWSLSSSESKFDLSLQGTKQGHNQWINCSFISPDDLLLGSASSDKTVKVWDSLSFCNGSVPVRTFDSFSSSVTKALFFSEKTFLSGDESGSLFVHDLRAPKSGLGKFRLIL